MSALQPQARIRFPAGGDAPFATSVGWGENSDRGTIPCKEFAIVDDVLNVADSFSCTIANVDGENAGKVDVGQLVQVDEVDPDVAGGDWCRTFTGRVVSVESGCDSTGGSVIKLGCMDLGWHLTSCHAKPLLKTNGIKLDALITKLVDPSWGFASTVGLTNANNRLLKQGRAGVTRSFQQVQSPTNILPYFQVEPGQTPWDVLEAYVRREGYLLNVGAEGNLILFRPDYSQPAAYDALHLHATSDERARQNNVKEASLRQSIDGTYSTAECWSTVCVTNIAQAAELQVRSAANPNAGFTHSVYTPPRNPLPFDRRFIVNDGEAINGTMRQNRATFAYQMGAFESWEYNATVFGHSSNRARYVSDSMVSVVDDVNGVSAGSYYVQRVQRSVTVGGGTVTRLTLRLPGLVNPTLQAQVTGGGAKFASDRQASRKVKK